MLLTGCPSENKIPKAIAYMQKYICTYIRQQISNFDIKYTYYLVITIYI